MTSPNPSGDFEQYARTKPMQGKVAESWLRPFRETVLVRLGGRNDARALDYGFGDGRFFEILAEHFGPAQVHGVEVSQIRTERARARGWDNALYVPAGTPMPYEPRSFDMVNMYEVIEHIPAAAIDDCLADIARVMKRDGVLILTTPNYPIKRVYDCLDAVKLRQWGRFRDDPTHVTFYGPGRLQRTLGAHFASVTVAPFKEGLFYARTGWQPLCHKLIAVCREPR